MEFRDEKYEDNLFKALGVYLAIGFALTLVFSAGSRLVMLEANIYSPYLMFGTPIAIIALLFKVADFATTKYNVVDMNKFKIGTVVIGAFLSLTFFWGQVVGFYMFSETNANINFLFDVDAFTLVYKIYCQTIFNQLVETGSTLATAGYIISIAIIIGICIPRGKSKKKKSIFNTEETIEEKEMFE